MNQSQINDRDIAIIFAGTPHHLILPFFEIHGQRISDDINYWNMLGTAWKAGGSFIDQQRWIALFKADRRNQQKIMKSSERREFARLPRVIKAYRCCDDEVESDQSICWSLDKKFVTEYAKKKGRTLIVERTFNKSDVFAYFNRRRESEILVWRV